MPEGSEYEDVSSLEDGGLYSADDLMSLYSPQFYQVSIPSPKFYYVTFPSPHFN